MEEGLRTPGIVAVVGEVGSLPMVASRRLQLAAERSGITAFVLRRWREGGLAAHERSLPNAAVTRWRIAALPSPPTHSLPRTRGRVRVGAGFRRAEVADRADALPRRRAGVLGNGGAGCDGSSISGCRAGRSTGGAWHRKNIGAPARGPIRHGCRCCRTAASRRGRPGCNRRRLGSGMPLADALSFLPGLATAPAKPVEDVAALRRLAEWCGRYSPWTSPDGADGVRIEITGSAHLWGGERALAADLGARLDRRRVASRIVIARMRSALRGVWPAFRGNGGGRVILAEGELRAALAPLPVEALRLRPDYRPRAAGRIEAGRRSLCDAARCAGPPVRRDRGAAARSGVGRNAGAVVATRRGAEPAGAVEFCRADYRARRSHAGDGAAHRGSRPSLGAGRNGSAAARSRLLPRRRPSSSGSASALPARAAIRATSRRSSGSGSTHSIPASVSKT